MTTRTTADSRDPLPSLGDLLRYVPGAMLLTDRDGGIVAANARACELFGRSPESLDGQPIETLFPERLRRVPVQFLEHCLVGEELPPRESSHELWGCRVDGSEFPVEMTLEAWPEESATHVLVLLWDVTEHHEAEERFRIAATHTADFIQVARVDEDENQLFGNVDELMGYRPGGFPRTISGFFELMHTEDRARVEGELEQVLASGAERWELRYRMRSRDGSYHHWLDRGTVTGFTPDGRGNAGVGAVQDVTERVLREQKLQETLHELEAARARLRRENAYLQEEIREGLDYGEIVGDSEPTRRTLAQVEQVAGLDATVLLTGETGTGKELLARALHTRSRRSRRTLIKVNCAALPASLIESELFGHEKGAFSGATAQRRGRFELADQGTLFLDEVGEIPLELQAKLLRVLQDGEFERLGSSKTLKTDVRLIAATNRDLRREAQAGRFRDDLYYRLAVFPLEVPPLRDRRSDIRPLVLYFVGRHNAKHGRSIEEVPEGTMAALEAYDWPGNVRELENLVERGVIVSPGRTLTIDAEALQQLSAAAPITSGASGAEAAEKAEVAAAAGTLEGMERAHIVAAMDASGWKVKGRGNAAERLGLNESTLRSRMKKLGIQRPK